MEVGVPCICILDDFISSFEDFRAIVAYNPQKSDSTPSINEIILIMCFRTKKKSKIIMTCQWGTPNCSGILVLFGQFPAFPISSIDSPLWFCALHLSLFLCMLHDSVWHAYLVLSVTVATIVMEKDMKSHLEGRSKRVEFWYETKEEEMVLTRTYFPLHEEVCW